jgi:signal transduction histidine kinase
VLFSLAVLHPLCRTALLILFVVTLHYSNGYGKQVPVTFEVSPEVNDSIITDEEWLWQMLLNLLTNACKYTDKGSIHVRISLRDSGLGNYADTSAAHTMSHTAALTSAADLALSTPGYSAAPGSGAATGGPAVGAFSPRSEGYKAVTLSAHSSRDKLPQLARLSLPAIDATEMLLCEVIDTGKYCPPLCWSCEVLALSCL